ncbi:MAG: PD-(D/E)XK nuclease family protein, partial [Tepidisphaeraceae bacterium]
AFSFSYSRWSTWDECPAKYKYKHIDKLPEPKSPAMAKGIEAHRVVAEYLEGKVDQRPDSLRLFTGLADGLREATKRGMCKVEMQVAFDKGQKRVEWFGKNAYWRFIWDAMAFDGQATQVDAVDWKGLAVVTPMLTDRGWSTMGDVQVGDCVLAPDGAWTRVTGKSEVKHLPCYRLDFDTGAEPIVCDDEHLWHVRAARTRNARVVPVTDVVAGDRIDLCDMEDGQVASAAALRPDPYVLGCWLGDGHRRDGMISKPDEALFENIEARGYSVLPAQPSSSDLSRCVVGLRGELRRSGLLNSKHVPDAYFLASVRARRMLVQGMMDTDGTWNKTRRRAVFTSMDFALARQI